jgi:hypothetical protein
MGAQNQFRPGQKNYMIFSSNRGNDVFAKKQKMERRIYSICIISIYNKVYSSSKHRNDVAIKK